MAQEPKKRGLFGRSSKTSDKKDKKEGGETMVNQEAKKKKQGPNTQSFLSFKAIRDGVVTLKNGDLRAVIMVSSINFSLLSFEEQKAKVYAYQDFLNSLEFPVQITIQSRSLNMNRYLAKIRDLGRQQENELLRLQMGAYHTFIEELVSFANVTTNRFYVVLPFVASPDQLKKGLFSAFKKGGSPAEQLQEDYEMQDKQTRELGLRVQAVVSGLQGIGLQAAQLGTQEIVELLYAWYNPVVGAVQPLAELDQLRVEMG